MVRGPHIEKHCSRFICSSDERVFPTFGDYSEKVSKPSAKRIFPAIVEVSEASGLPTPKMMVGGTWLELGAGWLNICLALVLDFVAKKKKKKDRLGKHHKRFVFPISIFCSNKHHRADVLLKNKKRRQQWALLSGDVGGKEGRRRRPWP